MKYLSLCIPTNGVEEWVFPVLDKIYKEKIDHNLWEVVLTNNGTNEHFNDLMIDYVSKHDNLIYKKTDSVLFENQIDALRLANGIYLKFLNHRSLIEPGTIDWMIEQIKINMKTKPIIYWSNGSLKLKKDFECDSFDLFVRQLREVASWTTGVGIWKSDFDSIPVNWNYNKISPHSDVLYWVKANRDYKILDKKWAKDIDASHLKKGKYDLFKAFAVEEVTITLNLYIDGYISCSTLKYVIKRYEKLVAGFYCNFVLLKTPCSYDLNYDKNVLDIFFNKGRVIRKAIFLIPKYIVIKMIYS